MLTTTWDSSHVWGFGTNSAHVWRIGTNAEELVPILLMCEKLVPVLHTCKRNWYQFFTHPKKHRSQVWRILTNSLHVRNLSVVHTGEKVAPVLHRCEEYLPILHTSESINMRNFSTNFRLQNLSKLTIRNFSFGQYDVFVSNSSYGCEIYEKRKLRSTKLWSIPVTIHVRTRQWEQPLPGSARFATFNCRYTE